MCACQLLYHIASAKTAAAIERHMPLAAAQPAEVRGLLARGHAAVDAAPAGGAKCCWTVSSRGGSDSCALDVVVALRVAAGSSAAELQERLRLGDEAHASSAHTACLLRWDAAAGAAWGVVLLSDLSSTWDCDRGGGGVPNLVNRSTTPGAPLCWDPVLWSRLAPGGELHWACRLFLLSD